VGYFNNWFAQENKEFDREVVEDYPFVDFDHKQ